MAEEKHREKRDTTEDNKKSESSQRALLYFTVENNKRIFSALKFLIFSNVSDVGSVELCCAARAIYKQNKRNKIKKRAKQHEIVWRRLDAWGFLLLLYSLVVVAVLFLL